jgi:hypothetical protein
VTPSPAGEVAASSVAPPGAAGQGQPPRRREIVLELAAAKGRRGGAGTIRLSGPEIVLERPGVLREALTLPAGLVEVASVERGSAQRSADFGRFPILKRLSASRVVPREHGIEGWAWTTTGGSALPMLAEPSDTVPNLALVFVKPLAGAEIFDSFEPGWVKALADRSPLGTPSIPGLLAEVSDAQSAEDAFRQLGVLGPMTDREIPPTMRRHLPGDRPANPQVIGDDKARTRTSVAPPGMG